MIPVMRAVSTICARALAARNIKQQRSRMPASPVEVSRRLTTSLRNRAKIRRSSTDIEGLFLQELRPIDDDCDGLVSVVRQRHIDNELLAITSYIVVTKAAG